MTPAKDLAQLGKLVAARHGWAQARTFKAYDLGEEDRARMAQCAVGLLKAFPKAPGTSALLSAGFAVQLERHLGAPVQLVAGTLTVDGVAVYADERGAETPGLFDGDAPQWRGHIWVMVGPWVADIAIFRAAYSSDCPTKVWPIG